MFQLTIPGIDEELAFRGIGLLSQVLVGRWKIKRLNFGNPGILITLVIITAIAIPVGLNYFRNKLSINTFETFSEPKQLTLGSIVWHNGIIDGLTVKKMGLFIPVKIKRIDSNRAVFFL